MKNTIGQAALLLFPYVRDCACPDEYRGRDRLHRSVRYSAYATNKLSITNSVSPQIVKTGFTFKPLRLCVKSFVFFCVFESLWETASAQQATWIWYPGDFEINLANKMQNRRTDVGANR